MDTIDKGLGGAVLGHLADVLGYLAVSQQHELLDKLVGVLCHMDMDSGGPALLVDVKLLLLAVEGHRAAILKTTAAQLLRHLVEHGEFVGQVALAGLQDVLSLLVGESPVAACHRMADFVFLHLCLGIHLHDDRVGEFVLVGSQRADVVAQFLGQHGDGAVHQIDRGGTLVSLLVDDGAWGDIVAHVGDVHTDFPVSVLKFLDGQGVVKVLGVGGVDGERRHVAHVASAGNLLGGDAVVEGFGSLGHIFGVLVRQTELGQDGMDFGIVLASHAQHVNDLADGRVGVLGPLHDFYNRLVARAASCQLIQGDKDVGSEKLAVGGQLGKVFHHLQRADKDLLLALEDFHYLGFRLQAVTRRTDVDQHAVAVQGVHRVALGNHDGLAVVAGGVHAVLAVAAADEDALGHRRAVSRLVAAGTHLHQETVHGELVQNFDDEHATLWCVGANGCRHLLVIEVRVALLIEEVNHPVVVLTTFLFQRL